MINKSPKYAVVAIPLPVNKLFSYIIPLHLQMEMALGKRDLVPFGARMLTGYVVDFADQSELEEEKLKEIEGEIPFALLERAFENIPPYMYPILEQVGRGTIAHYPQPCSSVACAASLVVGAIVKIVKGEIPRIAPEFSSLEPMAVLEAV